MTSLNTIITDHLRTIAEHKRELLAADQQAASLERKAPAPEPPFEIDEGCFFDDSEPDAEWENMDAEQQDAWINLHRSDGE